jgi:hypothetical protein
MSTGSSFRRTPESADPVELSNPFNKQDYFLWLCDHVNIPEDAGDFETTLKVMFSTEFVWVVGNDENRIADGRDLRSAYLAERDMEAIPYVEPVKFLEVLIGISERVQFLVDEPAADWAWKLMRNIGLGGFHDPLTGREVRKVMGILEKVIWRRYNPDGSGGFFPLTSPKNDQRMVEIWYQMSAYINENRESFGL